MVKWQEHNIEKPCMKKKAPRQTVQYYSRNADSGEAVVAVLLPWCHGCTVHRHTRNLRVSRKVRTERPVRRGTPVELQWHAREKRRWMETVLYCTAS